MIKIISGVACTIMVKAGAGGGQRADTASRASWEEGLARLDMLKSQLFSW